MKIRILSYPVIFMCLVSLASLAGVIASGGAVNAQTSDCSCQDAGCGPSQMPPTEYMCSAVAGTDPENTAESCMCGDNATYTIMLGTNYQCLTAQGGCCSDCTETCAGNACITITATVNGCAGIGSDPLFPCGHCSYTYSV